jgi:predicted permease
MIGWIRNLVIIFLLLILAYAVLSATSNFRQRQKLKSEYHGEAEIESKEAFIERGLRDYNRSIRPKMLLGVYIIPFAAIILLIYLAQT